MSETQKSGNKRFIVASVWLSLVAAVLIAAGVWLFAKLQPSLLIAQIREAAFAGDYDTATAKLETLAKKDGDRVYEAALSAAEIADYRKDREIAKTILETYLGDGQGEAYEAYVPKAEALLDQITYHQAMDLYEQGSYAKASSLAAGLKDHEPAQRLYELSYQALIASQPTPVPTPTLTPTPAPTETPVPTIAPTYEQPAETFAPTETPGPTPTPAPRIINQDRIAVGYAHCVFLREDGTVLAVGDNTYGQTDVAGWNNVVAVAAGAYHTVGLTADGRVLAAGDNSHGQTDVALFTNAEQIAAGAWDTCVLLSGGQVMSVGFHTYDFALELVPASRIAAGSYGLVVRSGGQNHASHPGLAVDARCEQVSLSRGYAMGIDADGKVHSTFEAIPAWDNVAAVSAGENAALALTRDGQVLSQIFDKHLRCTFDFGQPVAGLCAGANQYAFVLGDGTIEIRYADGKVQVLDEKLW